MTRVLPFVEAAGMCLALAGLFLLAGLAWTLLASGVLLVVLVEVRG